MFQQNKTTQVNLLLDGSCNVGQASIALTLYYECRDLLIRDGTLTVSVYAGLDKEALAYYKAHSFPFPTETFNDVSNVQTLVMNLPEYSEASIV